MAIEIKQSLKLAQQLVVTPQLQQAIKLLQLSRLELSTLIQHELLENPILEEQQTEEEEQAKSEKESHAQEIQHAKEDDKGHDHSTDEVGSASGDLLKEPVGFDWENYIGIYNAPGVPTTERPPADLPSYETTLTRPESMQEHLIWQIHLSNFSEKEVGIATEIAGNINDDGYLTSTLQEIAAKAKASVETVEAVLSKVQELDPPGVAARNIKECLILQTKMLGKDNNLIIKIIENHLSDLEFHNYSQIAKKMKISVDDVKKIAHFIQELEPKPGRSYSQESAQYITPDVYVHKIGGEYVVTLNEDGMPKLQVSNFYRRTMMSEAAVTNQTKEYINDKMRQAMWLIKSIHQRQRTLFKVAKSIVKFQRDFLDKGISHLKPMVLKDVAEDIDMHESTISRVTSNKYMHTPRGIFELKYFFGPGVKKVEGEDIASEAVKNTIKGLIEAENTKKPLSDQEIAAKLKVRNIEIARRTVAKYREALNIPPSSKRRRFE